MFETIALDFPTRKRILEAALSLFAQRGYKGTNTREICRVARVNVAAVNYHCGSKGKLWEAVCEYCVQWLSRLVLEKADPSKPPHEALPLIIDAIFNGLVTDSRPVRIIVWTAMQADELNYSASVRHLDPLIHLLFAYLKQSQEKGMIPAGIDIETAAPMIYSIIIYSFTDQVGHRRILGKDFSDPDNAERWKKQIIRSALLLLGLPESGNNKTGRQHRADRYHNRNRQQA